jgi:hypothetical protein
VESRSIVKEFYLEQGTLGLISISPDGKELAFAAIKGPHYIWNTDGTPGRKLPVDGIIDAWPGNNMEQWKSMTYKIAARNLSRAEYTQYIDPTRRPMTASMPNIPPAPNYQPDEAQRGLMG